jgi:hypothetical protein
VQYSIATGNGVLILKESHLVRKCCGNILGENSINSFISKHKNYIPIESLEIFKAHVLATYVL